MLRNISPILTGEFLHVLSDMGHGDEIVIGDGNFSSTRDATQRPVIWLAGYSTTEIASAVLSVMPLDDMDQSAFHIVETLDDQTRAVWKEFAKLVKPWATDLGRKLPDVMGRVPRTAFHVRAQKAYAVVATNDRRLYACFTLIKGALPEPLD